MNKTVELLNTIRDMVITGKLAAKDVEMADIIAAVLNELAISRQLFDESEYVRLESNFVDSVTNLAGDTEEKLLTIISMGAHAIEAIPEADTLMTRTHFKEIYKSAYTSEIDEVASNIERNRTTAVFNYPWTHKYSKDDIEVCNDTETNHFYVVYHKHKMFFPKGWDVEKIKEYVLGILIEQDDNSPHCYENSAFGVDEGDVIIDAGVAEGNFALKYVDEASHIYLIEADKSWVEALQLTFGDYSEKVTIINKYLCDETDDTHIKLDDVCNRADFVKMDIEGYERLALMGSTRLMEESPNLRMAICAYHKDGDEKWIKKYLEERGYKTATSRGYMFPEWEVGALKKAMLRRGLVFAKTE